MEIKLSSEERAAIEQVITDLQNHTHSFICFSLFSQRFRYTGRLTKRIHDLLDGALTVDEWLFIRGYIKRERGSRATRLYRIRWMKHVLETGVL